MPCNHPHDRRTARCRRCTQLNRSPAALQSRAIALDMLRSGKWVHGEKLWIAAYADMPRHNVKALIFRLRREGYEIDSEGGGQSSRGYRLISEREHA
ncbi:hypothetical protein PX699_13520 [Sphingobium sp. H39-3-25]|uniref:hypothetical protein n=1 Tax=Sphingobium arseniciresistens TaxID=3030834 RepID=UPI0023B9CF8F|nr:hypothetical protein [Sphingobium arseniciresistens]